MRIYGQYEKKVALIERASKLHPIIRPCHNDWEKSFTLDTETDKLMLWYNVPISIDGDVEYTTKLLTEE